MNHQGIRLFGSKNNRFCASLARRTRSRSGVTLMELMVATVVMTVAVIGLMGSFSGIQKALQVSKNKTLASNLSQEKMQILKQKNYYQVLVTPDPAYFPFNGTTIPYDYTYFPPETILEGSVTYTRLTYVQVATEDSGAIVVLPPTTPDTGMKLITTTVVWTVAGEQKKLVVNSVLANPNTVMTNSVYKGVVKDATTTNPIAGALVNLAENLGWRDTTDAGGNYKITVSPGNYTMVVSAPGYFTQYLPTSIISNTITTMPTFNLTPMSSGTVTGTAWVNSHIVISQVVADTFTFCQDASGGITQRDVEFVEFFNPTNASVYMGQTGDYYYTNTYNLWFMGSSGGAYQYTGSNASWFNTHYVNNNIASGGYYLFANTPRFLLNGIWVTADAYFVGGNQTAPEIPHYMSADATQAGYIAWAHYPNGPTIDSVGWNNASISPTSYWVPTISSITIPNFGNGLGTPKGNSLVRISSPAATASDLGTYGHAYNASDPRASFLYPSGAFSGVPYTPHNVSSGTFPIIAGTPAVGAVITANDPLSDPAQAVSVGYPPVAKFTLNNVATATISSPWTVVISSGLYSLENDTVTIASSGSNYNFPSSTTILNVPATQGFIAGSVVDVLGNPITSPVLISVSPGANGVPANASAANGRYLLRVSTGNVDVTANPSGGSNNNNYVTVSSLAVTVALGQISDGVDFVLTQGGQISGFVTRDGVNALPGVAVTAFDVNGVARDTRITDNNGRFTTLVIATGTYSVAPELDSLENSSPINTPVTVAAGSTIFSTTFTISGALGTIMGNATLGGKPISTGVLIVVTTSTLAGSPPAPPVLSSTTLATNSYYIASSKEDGSYSVDVRQSTNPAYNVYGYYTTVTSTGAVTIQSTTLANVQVVAGSSVTGNNFAW